MLNAAVWGYGQNSQGQMLKKEHGYDDSRLAARVTEIDMRDGKLDGRIAPSAEMAPLCPKCSRKLAKKRPFCLYCGTPVQQDVFGR